jgi:hypothetical protein
MYRMKTHSVFPFDCVTNLDLLLRSRQLSFELYILLSERGHRLFDLLACLLQLSNVLPGFLISVLRNVLSSDNGDKN